MTEPGVKKTKSRGQGFSLLEVLIVVALFGFFVTTALFSFEGILERWSMNRALEQVTQTLKHAQFLSLTQRRSHGITGSGAELWIVRTGGKSVSVPPWVSLPGGFAVSANQWPSFSPHGFANAGTVSLESQNYLVQIKVGPIGSIRSTDLQGK